MNEKMKKNQIWKWHYKRNSENKLMNNFQGKLHNKSNK